MGEAANDMFDCALRDKERMELVRKHGVKPCDCRAKDADGNCVDCCGLGYIDKNGNPFDF